MNIEALRAFCLSLPSATEDIKWGHDLCFSIGGKMFCVTRLEPPSHLSFKVDPDNFESLCSMPGFGPAPYVARYHWVLLKDLELISGKRLETYVMRSYDLVKGALSKKTKIQLRLSK